MADDASDDDKTEQPTEKKLRDAIEQGNVPVSREASLFAFLGATLILCTLMLREGAGRLLETLVRMLDSPGTWSLSNGADAAGLVSVLVGSAAGFLVPIFILFIMAGLAVSFAQNLPRVVLSRIAPDLSKLSPAKGLSRMFGRDGLVQFGKGLFKLTLILGVVALVLSGQREIVIDAIFREPIGIPDTMMSILSRLLSGVVTVFTLLVVADLFFSRVSWSKKMLMSRRDIKDEMKQAEGDPHVKAKRRSLAMDRARRRMMKDVTKATMVIANPTHFAIALRYVREETAAPVVIAKGQDLIALKIREIAERNNITVIEDKLLARSMYDHVEVAQAIPPQFYKAVAEIIHFITTKNKKSNSLERSQVLR